MPIDEEAFRAALAKADTILIEYEENDLRAIFEAYEAAKSIPEETLGMAQRRASRNSKMLQDEVRRAAGYLSKLADIEEAFAKMTAERDSWRRVAETLEREKQRRT